MTADRISPEQAARDVQTDSDAVLLCAYADPEKCRKYRLNKSVSLSEFRSRPAASRFDRKLLVYCA